MTDYLPKNYQEPKLPTNYLRSFEQGDTRVRILSPMIRGWKYWVEGGFNPTTKQEEKGRMIYLPEDAKVDPRTKPKYFWGFVVFNYNYEMLQIMEIISTQIKEPLMGYFHDPHWGDPRHFDIAISREGVGLKTRYQVRPYPISEISEAVAQLYQDANIRLEALFEGQDPFKEHVDVDIKEVERA